MNSANISCPTTTLYVGDLHPDVTESMLLERFSPIGPVETVRVCTDKTTGKSLCYAYVNFCHPQDAERALDTMNYEAINGRPMRIMWSQKEPTLRKSGVGNIFIKNLDKTIDSKVLYDTFSIFGNIVSSKLATDEEGNSKGYGFVHFETGKVAKKAISKVNGMLFNSKKVYVGKFLPRSEREKTLGRKPVCPMNLYVKNFNDYLDDDKLKKMFEKYGEIISVKVMLTEEGKSKGFGFVCFEDSEKAKSAIDELNNKEVDGKILYVGRAQKKAERQAELKRRFEAQKAELRNKSKGANLYVKNLDEEFDDERLRNEFSSFGTVKCAKVMRDSDNRSRGFGFVCFSSPDEASEALKEMHKRFVVSKPLYVAYAQRKEDRSAYIASQFLQKMQKFHKRQYLRPSLQTGTVRYYRPNMPQSQRCYIPT